MTTDTNLQYSRYYGECESENTPVRIDEGPFEGTIYTYDDIKVEDDDKEKDAVITYALGLVMCKVDGMEVDSFTSDQLNDLNENFTKPILINILTESANVAIAEHSRREALENAE